MHVSDVKEPWRKLPVCLSSSSTAGHDLRLGTDPAAKWFFDHLWLEVLLGVHKTPQLDVAPQPGMAPQIRVLTTYLSLGHAPSLAFLPLILSEN